jgi:beta-lactamase regulating signal transducer with metallopeptidase domain
MHLTLIVIAVGIALGVRQIGHIWFQPQQPVSQRWHWLLGQFLFPPLLLLWTAIAVSSMGTEGHMLGLPVGWIGCLLSCGFLVAAGLMLFWQMAQGWRSVYRIRSCPRSQVKGRSARILATANLFTAQIGFWQPELVVSQGMLTHLTSEQLQAVLTHEQAHLHYRDTFWFFWLGWIRRLTFWLPYTETLWQELLLLRELRADQWATRQVDPLLLAESLLLVVRSPCFHSENCCAAFGATTPINRLEERIEALLGEPNETQPKPQILWIWMSLVFVPLLTVLFHH